ncbi:MAG: hypothetical protein HEP71_00695 [Roseivirga sp.]|nr:hypothetical protein [Roseivirga sp.]
MAKRIKKRIVVAPPKEEVGEVMRSFAEASSKLKELEAQEELQLLEVRKNYSKRAEALLEEKQNAMEKLEAFGIHNKDELFGKKKSMDLHHGVIGFRTGTPKVNKPRSITWNQVIETLNEAGSDFLRTRIEVDKDKIIACRNDEDAMQELAKMGVGVVQEETFFITIREGQLEAMAFAMA